MQYYTYRREGFYAIICVELHDRNSLQAQGSEASAAAGRMRETAPPFQKTRQVDSIGVCRIKAQKAKVSSLA